ncbi:hypothetical protein COU57_01750 [Candidatus Pacearchaeota archaeon CG10_big_fil_rev_8_21_14_0_10_32_14]|nr:MAG: hypothetical protein COU57_01750 [Candidatus Pacearchaeota archaeon CG10_big_fil_rev_8_21_14_0_10_32_14]
MGQLIWGTFFIEHKSANIFHLNQLSILANQDINTIKIQLNQLSPQVQTLLNGNILSRLTSIENKTLKINELDLRVKALENKTQNNTPINSPYLKYLSSSDRKNIICGYAQDNHLTSYEDLGWHCDMTYTTSRSGRESVKCKCYKT